MGGATLGTVDRPLTVAVVGAGPAGLYAADALLRRPGVKVRVDVIERLPAPFGLVRYGVAPDHQKIKSVTAAYERILSAPRVRYLGNVPVGDALSVAELLAHYDQVVLAVGCETDRRLGIPGEDLEGSHAAAAFVYWYNGHPLHQGLRVSLDTERAVVVGVGDVSLDVARLLVQAPDRLATTDIADEALSVLRTSRIREVVLLGRRGAAHAAFAVKELADVAELPGVHLSVDEAVVRAELESGAALDGPTRRKLEFLAAQAAKPPPADATRRVVLRFLASPVALLGDAGRLRAVRIEENRLEPAADGSSSARGTGRTAELDCGLVVRAVGYRGLALPGVPFDERAGLVPNEGGRVTDAGVVVPRLYVAGWIKRGPSGVIGTNKADAAATVDRMMEDLPALTPRDPSSTPAAVDALLRERGVRVVDWEAYRALDAREREDGR
ncbi:MAG: FAD-dependent oxidoreductase, partial [Deltaproteobacteria bacterium]|nr:FAD-dependent oxidoreductase [Deltaproteobacteria bacterium]